MRKRKDYSMHSNRNDRTPKGSFKSNKWEKVIKHGPVLSARNQSTESGNLKTNKGSNI